MDRISLCSSAAAAWGHYLWPQRVAGNESNVPPENRLVSLSDQDYRFSKIQSRNQLVLAATPLQQFGHFTVESGAKNFQLFKICPSQTCMSWNDEILFILFSDSNLYKPVDGTQARSQLRQIKLNAALKAWANKKKTTKVRAHAVIMVDLVFSEYSKQLLSDTESND